MSTDDSADALTLARRHLIVRRIPYLVVAWPAVTLSSNLVLVREGLVTPFSVASFLGIQLSLLLVALAVCRSSPLAPRVERVAMITCVLLGISSTCLFAAVGGEAALAAFLLLMLSLMSSLLFAWGWRVALALLVVTALSWFLAYPFLKVLGSAVELGAAIVIGAAVCLAVADNAERNFKAAFSLRAQEAQSRLLLQNSRDVYRDLAENASDLIFAVDLGGRFTYANATLASYTGRSSSELIGRFSGEVLSDHPENPDFGALIDRLAARETLAPVHFEARTVHGLRWLESVPSLITDASGSAVGVRGICRDVTERTRAQDELAAALVREQEVRKQAERAETEMRVAKEEAEVANRAKGDFLTTMSHEIRNPMDAVIASARLLLGTDLKTEQREYARVAQRSADALLTIVDDILDLAKIEAGKVRLTFTELSVARVIEEVADIFAERAQNAGLEMVALTSPSVATPVRGDAGRLRQVLINLVGNAIKFTDRGEVVVGARTVEETLETVLVRFAVEDTGIGIAAEAHGRLFQPFSQLDGGEPQRYGGTGLGLAISKRLVELMGGTIGVESKPGGGSTFWFAVRFRRAEGGSVTPVRGFATDPVRLPTLVADDNARTRAILHDVLTAWGFPCDTVADGGQAIARLRQATFANAPYAIVLLDLDMPQQSGLDVARVIAADAALQDTRTVLLTPFGTVGVEKEFHRARLAAWLPKPLQTSRLRACLEQVIAQTPATLASSDALVEAEVKPSIQMQAEVARKRILLVEDDEDIQMLTARVLENAGYQVDVVGDGSAAFAAAVHTAYDLLLMDSRLPGMDGFQATRAIREHERGSERRVPIIALTANASARDRDRCLAEGMDAVLSKPVRSAIFLETVAQWSSGGVGPNIDSTASGRSVR